MAARTPDLFNLTDRVVVITGGAGLLGIQHATAIAEAGGVPVLADLDGPRAVEEAARINDQIGPALGATVDVTNRDSVADLLEAVLGRYGRVDGLVNNAAVNPKVENPAASGSWSRFEDFPIDAWENDIAVTLTGAMICSQVIGKRMAASGRGSILNIASDLALISPDQRIYREPSLAEADQPVKPVSYVVAKSGLLGLTRYLATYWATSGVRVNALCPGGVEQGQEAAFVERLTNLVPMGRMARVDEYRGAVVFLLGDASSYMTGSIVSIDGGRTSW